MTEKTDLLSTGDTKTIFSCLRVALSWLCFCLVISQTPSVWLFERLRTMSFNGVCFLLSISHDKLQLFRSRWPLIRYWSLLIDRSCDTMTMKRWERDQFGSAQ